MARKHGAPMGVAVWPRDAWDDCPEAMRRVALQMRDNARERFGGFGDADGLEPVYLHCNDDGVWQVGANFEGGTGTYLYDPAKDEWWYRRYMADGPDTPTEFEVALSDAGIWFTG